MKFTNKGIDLGEAFGLADDNSSKQSPEIIEESSIIKEIKALNNNQKTKNGLNVTEIPVSLIRSNNNPRKLFDENKLKQLATNIKERGLLQPIGVRKHSDWYELIYGERRLRAFKINNYKTIPAIISDVKQIPPETIPEIKLLENLQREDLTDHETAQAILGISNTQGYSDEKLAKILNMSIAWVKQKMIHANLISSLEDEVKDNTRLSDFLFALPTTVFIDLQSSLKSNKKKVLNWLENYAKTDTIPKKQEVREFTKSLKSNIQSDRKSTPEKNLKTLTIDQLKRLIASIDKKIANLNIEKSLYEKSLKSLEEKNIKKKKNSK
ncbi:ParB/RepB/Spo0J family partition protein (plasmid) [Leptospira interrogans]|uniref:ParB/RepB/Spo0J family partition protein n=1 Tax=Leptospira interrogans serovar Bataviae TaxID=312175 RepID=A0AAP9WSW9_LEPIR|nr:ParB/RepB/Spo0J family partition protein [Leptospira interrogans]KAA1292937.1 ParB/RepB/Spo0J family partition protein [Leptospira interrogans serovar Geyaweera]QOI53207.1 ParB/RepB/Spo0J family partition protein [Leptospira interrogans serovar Bataviae]MCL8311291.1 ParB/RepB/Spo0J family partition protein [Leptospira interrogans]MCR8640765.1 chromosome partitioning protein ParB [Leptospira interrogans serovar Ricardi]ULG86474.1 ParB/RepB/Spo0J family partition protein [Leptospira interroga